ncbi:hypothetical protein V7793_07875 [Streptomyces sp. KLMMK]|uniref:hypothetical protein n=1 Tax=Streptomyces sp. KLMMK TaxID=3109353 RepID=UPI00300A5D04
MQKQLWATVPPRIRAGRGGDEDVGDVVEVGQLCGRGVGDQMDAGISVEVLAGRRDIVVDDDVARDHHLEVGKSTRAFSPTRRRRYRTLSGWGRPANRSMPGGIDRSSRVLAARGRRRKSPSSMP